jgi:hypothetical protein
LLSNKLKELLENGQITEDDYSEMISQNNMVK